MRKDGNYQLPYLHPLNSNPQIPFPRNLTTDGFKKISEDGKINHFPTLLKAALDVSFYLPSITITRLITPFPAHLQTDLREIGDSTFPTESRAKFEVPKRGLVVQVVKIVRNVAAPKANQDSKFAPRLLKVQFTDGKTQFSGIELEHLNTLSLRDTKPGTKLFLRPGSVIQIAQDLLLLRANYFDVLGGHVQELVDKWEVAQRYSKYSTGIRAVAQAPPWIAFGQKIDRKSLNVNKKSLAGGGVAGAEDEKEEDVAFDNQRKEAIAEAQKLEPKQRVFLDAAKKIVHHNVQKIVDKGYSEEVAKEALRYTRNDLSKAMANLKKGGAAGGGEESDGRFRSYSGRGGGRGGRRGGRFGGGGGRGGDDDYEGEEFMARPSEKISLFDFIGDKLPPEIKNAAAVAPAKPAINGVPPAAASGFNRHQASGGGRERFGGNSHHENHSSRGGSNPRHGNARPQEFQKPAAYRAESHRGATRGGHQQSDRRNNERNNNNHSNHTHQQYQPQSQQPYQQRNNGYANNGANLARDMERMSLSNNPRQHQQAPNHQQRQQQPQKNNHHQQSNGFPSLEANTRGRTPGFLNKESNEAAKKFLEQQVPLPPGLSQPGPQFQQNHRGPTKQQATAVDDSKSGWNWKLGDRCLAKYWEDGKVRG